MAEARDHHRSTIRDVAQLAGVGVATVSRALNGSPLVAEETRARVLAAAEKLAFVPTRSAVELGHSRAGQPRSGRPKPKVGRQAKWLYRVEFVSEIGNDELAKYGAAGWEIIAVLPKLDGCRLVMKKPS